MLVFVLFSVFFSIPISLPCLLRTEERFKNRQYNLYTWALTWEKHHLNQNKHFSFNSNPSDTSHQQLRQREGKVQALGGAEYQPSRIEAH